MTFSQFLYTRPKILIPIALWLAITATLSYALVKFKLHANTAIATHQASLAYDTIYEKVQINKTVLLSLSSLIKLVGDGDEVRAFTREMLTAFPHIYTVGFQQYVNHDDKNTFIATQKQRGLTDFDIKDFDYENRRIFHGIEDKEYYYPTFFIEPMDSVAKIVMGLDQFAVPFLKNALIQSIETLQPVASRPFTLAEGGRGYVLYKAIPTDSITRTHALDSSAVSMAVKVDELIEYASAIAPEATIVLTYKDADDLTVEDEYATSLKPPFTIHYSEAVFTRTFRDIGQPFKIQFVYTNGLTWFDLLVLLLIVVLMSGVLAIALYIVYKRHLRLIHQEEAVKHLSVKNEHLESKVQIRTAELERQKNANSLLSQKLISSQEEEFHSLARELHDEFGQNLTAINTNAKILDDSLSGNANALETSKDIRTHVNQLYDSLHTMMRRLRPETLDTFGLKLALERLIASFKFEESGIACHFTYNGEDGLLTEQQTITVYRAAQELLNNCIRHSNATKISVVIQLDNKQGTITVSDNGKTTSGEFTYGFGLLGLEERTRSIKGELVVAANNGWTVTLSFPIEAVHGEH